MKRTLFRLLALTLLASLSAWASPLGTLIKQERKLSAQIKNAYIRGEDPSPYYNRLIQVHRTLLRAPLNREMKNMAVFLSYCLGDLRQALTAPRTRANAEIVSDLDQAIQEGTTYIGSNLSGHTLASR